VVRVSVVLDTAPADVAIPGDLAGAPQADPVAAEFFVGPTPPSWHQDVIAPIEGANGAATRARRVETAMSAFAVRQEGPWDCSHRYHWYRSVIHGVGAVGREGADR
jgi:uncharacterized protein YdeI (YjbR/CyaY-like superfamily)